MREKSGRRVQESCSLVGTGSGPLTEACAFCPSTPSSVFSGIDPLLFWPSFFIRSDGVSQRPLLDATYGLSSSWRLSALGLEPHLPLLLHKHSGSWHVQRVSALPLTPKFSYFLAEEI